MPLVPIRSTILWLALLALAAAAPTAAVAKSKGKSCAAAEAAFQATGAGDRDGDGLSDCREKRQLHTSMTSADTDGDSVGDGTELNQHTDPLNVDSDDDGVDDADDDTPGMPEQKVKALLDAAPVCPTMGVPGSISVLGITVPLIFDLTEFNGTTCDELVARFGTGVPSVFVEIEILEDSLGALTATEVGAEQGEHHDAEGPDVGSGAQEGAN